MTVQQSGHLRKMVVSLPETATNPVQYQLPIDDQLLPLNGVLGNKITLKYTGAIHCTHCGRRSNKSFSQGFCYPCFTKLAQCDQCIVSPEKCHFHKGTCRDPGWGEEFCMNDHIVYLANSSGVKVGITRATQLPTRWIDQGAVQALPIMRVSTRYQSGRVEDALRQHVADKTNWRTMLKGAIEPVDLAATRDSLFEKSAAALSELENEFGLQALQRLRSEEPCRERV